MKKHEHTQKTKELAGFWWRLVQVFYWLAVILFIFLMLLSITNFEGGIAFIAFAALTSVLIYQVLKKLMISINISTKKLEPKRSWRIINVTYWLILLILILSLATYNDYGDHSLMGLSVSLFIFCLPIYLVLAKVYTYIIEAKA